MSNTEKKVNFLLYKQKGKVSCYERMLNILQCYVLVKQEEIIIFFALIIKMIEQHVSTFIAQLSARVHCLSQMNKTHTIKIQT